MRLITRDLLKRVRLWKHAFPLETILLGPHAPTEHLESGLQFLHRILVLILGFPPLFDSLSQELLCFSADTIGKFSHSSAHHTSGPAVPIIGIVEFVLRDPHDGQEV
jgi:hypothetical protein